MADKNALDKADIEEYEKAMGQLANAKEEFKVQFGVAFHEYVPGQIDGPTLATETLHKVEVRFPPPPPTLDRSFVAQKRWEAYEKQYPEDQEVDPIKLEQIELDPET
jgi:hypothetical protein